MKKRMLKVIMIVIGVMLVVMFGWYISFVRFGIGPAFPFLPEKTLEMNGEGLGVLARDQLMALVESEQNAEEIAYQYGIELIEYKDGVATFRTEEDPQAVIDRGQENGYYPLYLNYVRAIN